MIYPLCSNDDLRDKFSTAFYTDMVSVPLTLSGHVDDIWQELTSRSNNQVKVLHVVAYCKEAMRGVELDAGCTTASVLRVIYPSLADPAVADTDLDLSVLGNRIDKYDFYEILCRLVSCDLWVLGKPKPAPATEEGLSEENESSSEAKANAGSEPVASPFTEAAGDYEMRENSLPLESKISKRLQAWFTDLVERKRAVDEQL